MELKFLFVDLSVCLSNFALKGYDVEVFVTTIYTGSRSAVGSESDCRSRGLEFDPGPVPYFMKYICGHSPPSADSRRVVVSYK